MPALALVQSAAPVVTNDEPPLQKLRKQYKDWQKAKLREQEEMRTARHYYHGDQLTTKELAAYRKRRQPPIIYNRTNRKVDGIVGILSRLRQDPKAYPRTPQHAEGAELGTAALRYALDQVRWPALESDGTRECGTVGIGGVELTLQSGDRGDPEIGLEFIETDTFFYDPRSIKQDFSDAKYMGTAKWMHVDDVKDLAPEHADALDGMLTVGADFAGLEQRDRDTVWMNVEKKHVRVAMHWYREGKQWLWCFYTADLELASGASPWVDEKGQPMCGMLPWSAFVDHDGDRYGFVRNLKSPQDELNARRSKALHELHTRRIITEKGAVDNIEKARQEWARPDGFVEVQRGFRFEADDGAKQAAVAGQLEMLAEAKAEIENFGPTLVEKGMEKSGRAIALLQQAGLSELGPFINAYRDWKIRVYRAVWCAIQKHWTSERWIRVTDSENMAQFIQLNGLTIDEFGRPQIVNALGSLDVDIILDEGPDTVTTMADTLEALQGIQGVPPQLIIELSPIQDSVKKRVLKMLEPPPPAPPDPELQQAKAVALEQEQAKTASLKAKALKDFAGASETMGRTFAPQPEQIPQGMG